MAGQVRKQGVADAGLGTKLPTSTVSTRRRRRVSTLDTGQRQRILARGEVVAISRTIRHRARCAHPSANSLVRRAGRAAGRAAGGAGPAQQGARAAPLDAVEQFV